MKWIKASERLPKNASHNDIYRWSITKILIPIEAFVRLTASEYDKIEWLDETESTPSGESMEEFLDDLFGISHAGDEMPMIKGECKIAMQRWASLQCAERDKEIDELIKDKVVKVLEWVRTRATSGNDGTWHYEDDIGFLCLTSEYLYEAFKKETL